MPKQKPEQELDLMPTDGIGLFMRVEKMPDPDEPSRKIITAIYIYIGDGRYQWIKISMKKYQISLQRKMSLPPEIDKLPETRRTIRSLMIFEQKQFNELMYRLLVGFRINQYTNYRRRYWFFTWATDSPRCKNLRVLKPLPILSLNRLPQKLRQIFLANDFEF